MKISCLGFLSAGTALGLSLWGAIEYSAPLIDVLGGGGFATTVVVVVDVLAIPVAGRIGLTIGNGVSYGLGKLYDWVCCNVAFDCTELPTNRRQISTKPMVDYAALQDSEHQYKSSKNKDAPSNVSPDSIATVAGPEPSAPILHAFNPGHVVLDINPPSYEDSIRVERSNGLTV